MMDNFRSFFFVTYFAYISKTFTFAWARMSGPKIKAKEDR